jgi:hypothetical protein
MTEEIKDIREDLVKLLEVKYHEFIYKKIFKILDTKEYTSNSNGIFIKLNDIEEDKIKECIDFVNSINHSSTNYLESEQDREENLKKLQEAMKPSSSSVIKISKPVKKSISIKKKKKVLKVPAVYKRIEQCMGRVNNSRKLEVYKGDSEDGQDYSLSNEESNEESDAEGQFNEPKIDDQELDDNELNETENEEDLDLKDLGLEISSDEDEEEEVIQKKSSTISKKTS